MALLINWEVAPGALTNNRTTTLVAVVDDGTPLATQMGRHARAVRPPGLAGVLHIAYKWLMVLLGSVARVDGSSLLGALNPFRGTFELPWMVAALSKLEPLLWRSQAKRRLGGRRVRRRRQVAKDRVGRRPVERGQDAGARPQRSRLAP